MPSRLCPNYGPCPSNKVTVTRTECNGGTGEGGGKKWKADAKAKQANAKAKQANAKAKQAHANAKAKANAKARQAR